MGLYTSIAKPVAAEAVRRAFIEGMCEEATSDLLSRSLEHALSHGGAQPKHMHARARRCQLQLLCMLRKAERAASLAGRIEELACAHAQTAVTAMLVAYSGRAHIADASAKSDAANVAVATVSVAHGNAHAYCPSA